MRARWEYLREPKAPPALDAAKSVTGLLDDEEEYQPDEGATEQVMAQIEVAPLPVVPPPPPAIKLGPYVIPQPPPLSHEDAIECELRSNLSAQDSLMYPQMAKVR